jgi:hypothetical protein
MIISALKVTQDSIRRYTDEYRDDPEGITGCASQRIRASLFCPAADGLSIKRN